MCENTDGRGQRRVFNEANITKVTHVRVLTSWMCIHVYTRTSAYMFTNIIYTYMHAYIYTLVHIFFMCVSFYLCTALSSPKTA